MWNQWPDWINGLFECVGGLFIFLSVRKTWRDKSVKGVSYLTVGFFTVWGLWNLYFYPYLNAPVSFIGSIGIAVMNLAWLFFILKYRKS